MEIEDIERYKIRYNIDKKSRKSYYIDNRMYLYAILFHIHNWSLSRIGKFFGGFDHASVRNALIQAHYIQHEGKFLENTELLRELYFFVIPPYHKEENHKEEEHGVMVTLNKKQYMTWLQTKDINEVYEMIYNLTVDKLYQLDLINKKKTDKYKHKLD
jgi:chromosomal replication initiation ATPase DnaA